MATIIAWPDVVAFAPELATMPVSAQDDILAHVNFAFNPSMLGGDHAGRLRLARIYLAGHLGTITATALATAGGPVTSETAGGLSRSYSVATAVNVSFAATGYGRALQELLRTSRARLPFVL